MEEQIKASELRLGNYVIGYNDKIYQLSLYDFHLMYSGADAGEIIKSFVPLTEQRLLDFGFKTTPLGFKISIGKERELTLALCNDKGKGEYYFYVMDDDDFTGFSIRLFYVHQLQNLFYALTYQELTLKKEQ